MLKVSNYVRVKKNLKLRHYKKTHYLETMYLNVFNVNHAAYRMQLSLATAEKEYCDRSLKAWLHLLTNVHSPYMRAPLLTMTPTPPRLKNSQHRTSLGPVALVEKIIPDSEIGLDFNSLFALCGLQLM